MCGIVGLVKSTDKINKFDDEDYSRIFEMMLTLDQVRGFHSTGVVGLGRNHWWKQLGTPKHLMSTDWWEDEIVKDGVGWIGHNRWATKGKVDADNAHPFSHGHFTGVHNGTLDTTTNLEGDGKFGTDSETFYYCMSQVGEEAALNKVRGPYCFVWLNAKDNTLNFARNSGRPLHYVFDTDGSFYFMSQENHLEVILKGMKYRARGSICKVKEHVHYKIDLSKKAVIQERSYKPEVEYKKPVYSGWSSKDEKDYYDSLYNPRTHNWNNNYTKRASEQSRLPVISPNNSTEFKAQYDIGIGDDVEFVVNSVRRSDEKSHGKGKLHLQGKNDSFKNVLFRVCGVIGDKLEEFCNTRFKGEIRNIWNIKHQGVSTTVVLVNEHKISKVEAEQTILTPDDPDPEPTYRTSSSYVTLKQWKESTKHGCSQCTADLHPDDHEEVFWLDSMTPLCTICSDNMTNPAYH